MSYQVSDEELCDEFSVFGIDIDDDAVTGKLQEMCTMHRLEASELVTEWVAFTHSKKNVRLELDTLDQFERERLSKRNQKTPKAVKKETAPVIHTIDSLPMDVEGAEELYSAYGGKTPKTKGAVSNKRQHTPENAPIKRFTGPNRSPAVPYSPASFSPASTTPAKKYNSRTNRGEVMVSVGSTNNVKWHGSGQGVTIEDYSTEQSISKNMKYMFQKLSEKRDVLNDMIEDMAEHLQKIHKIEEYMHVALPTQEEVTVAGRICCDSNGKLNPKSVVLEGSIDTSSGKTIPVDLSQLKEYALFPGQLVAMAGHNSTGQKFVASKLFESVSLPLPEIPANTDTKNTRLSVMVAAGPFSTSDCLSYEPFTDLIEQIQLTRPDVCILMGPFVDCKNAEIENGKLTVTYDDIFTQKLDEVATVTANLNVQLVVLPSQRDMHHDPVYPTLPYSLDKTYKHVHFASDPCTLRINNIVFGLTSTDVLFHMGTEEITFPPGSSDRLGRLTQHLLNQHSYYPYYPPHEEMCIDYEKFQTTCIMPTTPHILIVPSEFKQFIKEMKGCCCINPGRLTKGLTGSTFAKIVVQVNELENNQSLVKNITAQVVRI
ncbi:DNA polymerase alpha subunit B-like isoform X1 [Mercenaria mercenaria]|uniref:DNA polymerase alpha subunit B-like isoform X1 n=2 Tax=Mercenaria mercenaria TaxID=6596 RepID=UPI00234EB4FA|nr:DNA polymerase alpha subunit B-like isoform X1 [Mercenaria mercenaria]